MKQKKGMYIMSVLNEHLAIKKLVELGVVIPGVFEGTVGNITYFPISIEEYIRRIESNDIQCLSYNTRTMGRGIFTFDERGRVVNYKGVDSKLEHSKSIAVANTEGEIESVNNQESYGINIMHFADRNLGATQGKSRLEFRVKGASQYQNLLYEKLKRDFIAKKDKSGLIKLPQLEFPTPLSEEMCEELDLPRVVDVTDDFLTTIDEQSYAGYCLSQMIQNGIQYTKRNQLWREYFEERHSERLKDEKLMRVVEREDATYGLGAIFGQSTRVLENPFRIMELEYFLRQNNIEALDAILDYTTKSPDDFMKDYATISGQNAAGFINLKLAINNFEHRQDFPLSGEICDDAFDDVSKHIDNQEPTREDIYKKTQYYYQVYIYATNMKILEDAFRATGRQIPSDYKRHFVETFYDSLEDKENFKMCFRDPEPMAMIKLFNNAEKNFAGMEEYMQGIREIAFEVYKERTEKSNEDNDEVDH